MRIYNESVVIFVTGTSPFGQYVKNVEKMTTLTSKQREDVDALIDGIYDAIPRYKKLNKNQNLYHYYKTIYKTRIEDFNKGIFTRKRRI